jgi:hypothetical protein
MPVIQAVQHMLRAVKSSGKVDFIPHILSQFGFKGGKLADYRRPRLRKASSAPLGRQICP